MMNQNMKPTHSGFETLRLAGRTLQNSGFHRFGSATNEQLTARGYAGAVRPSQIFSDFVQR